VSRIIRRSSVLGLLPFLALLFAVPAQAQTPAPPSMARFLSAPYPFELVAARKADRIAWLVLDRGTRNVCTAAGPAYQAVRLTTFTADDGTDISSLAISDDGRVVVFVRGHSLNREGWAANPTANPDGAERAFWAVRTAGGGPWRLGEGTTPVLSPDGRSVLYVRDGRIYRYAVSRTQPARTAVRPEDKPLITAWGSSANPRWSPDGTKVAFVSDRVDHGFIGIYDTRKRTVLFLAPSVDRDTSPTWSPDGRQVAFIRRPGLAFGQQAQQGTGGIGNPTGPAYVPGQTPGRGGQGRGGAQAAGRGGSGPESSGRAAVPGLTTATFAGGHTIAFWVGDPSTGDAREVWHNAAGDKVFTNITTIQWAGDRLVFPSEPEEWIRYYAVPAAGDAVRPAAPVVLTPGEGMVEQVGLSRDGRTLFYSTNAGDIDRRHVWKVPTAGGEAVRVTTGEGIETYPAVIGGGVQVAVLSADARRPQSIGLVPSSGGAVRVVYPTLPKDFPLAQHVVPQNVIVKAPDGLEIHNQLFLPPGLQPGERRPAIVFVHGGPVRQMLLGYHYMWFYHLAYMMNQWLANQGYVVFSVNYRSGIGYGKSFRMAPNTGARGNAEYQDLLAAGRYLQTRADVDPKKVGIWGLSYGGLLTAQALARNSDIFVAGVDFAGVHLYTNVLDPENVAYKSSAVSAIDGWKSPVLLVHGDDDRNVAFTQTTGLVQLLRAHDVPHEVIVFPDDVHESLLYSRWLYTFDRMEAFLAKHLK
jgi:dipeptidyl aminopeptidase/acylaminoacyl peptidase